MTKMQNLLKAEPEMRRTPSPQSIMNTKDGVTDLSASTVFSEMTTVLLQYLFSGIDVL